MFVFIQFYVVLLSDATLPDIFRGVSDLIVDIRLVSNIFNVNVRLVV